MNGDQLQYFTPTRHSKAITANNVREGIAALRDKWMGKARFATRQRWITWTLDGPRLGASTLLAPRVEGYEARLLALTSIAFERRLSRDLIDRLKRAEEDFRRGQFALSAMHVALANLPALDDMESCRRLHMCAGFLDYGFLSPLGLMKLTEIDASEIAKLMKYSEDEPRVPAGQTGGGEWTDEDGGTSSSDRKKPGHSNDVAILLPEGCDEEWKKAIEICIELLKQPNPPRSLTGGHTTTYGCAKGFVSARCGGNPV